MLDNALDYGLTEEQFWSMTFAELERWVNSRIRVQKREAQQKASFDYILANLIAKGVSKVLGDKSDYPTIEEVYTGLFDDVVAEREAEKQKQKDSLSALRFKQFAQSYNNRFKDKEVLNDK